MDSLQSCIPVQIASDAVNVISEGTIPINRCSGGVISKDTANLEQFVFCETIDGPLEILDIDSTIDLRSALAYVTLINGYSDEYL